MLSTLRAERTLLRGGLEERRHVGVAQRLLVDADVVDRALDGPGPLRRTRRGHADLPGRLPVNPGGGVGREVPRVDELAVHVDLRRAGRPVDDARHVIPLAGLVLVLPGAGSLPLRFLGLGAGDPMLEDELLAVAVADPLVPAVLVDDA